MKKHLILASGLTSVALFATGCQSTSPHAIGMANPASTYCVNQGGQSFIKKDAQGAEVGYCRLPNGAIVEEWDFFRKNNK